MITRRVFIGSVAGGLLAAPLAVEAQPEGNTLVHPGRVSPKRTVPGDTSLVPCR